MDMGIFPSILKDVAWYFFVHSKRYWRFNGVHIVNGVHIRLLSYLNK